jgi:hypothetical protein
LAVAAREALGPELARLLELRASLAQSSFKNFTNARDDNSPIALLSGIRWRTDATSAGCLCLGKR